MTAAPLIPAGFQGKAPPRAEMDEPFPLPPDVPAEFVVPQGMTDEQARALSEKRTHFSDANQSQTSPESAINDKSIPENMTSQSVTSNNPKDVAARGKCPVHLVPPCLIRATAEALDFGANKRQPNGYGEFNWRTEPVQLRNYLAAIMRHTLAILDGDDYDADSGLEHLSHIAATCAIVMDAADHGTLIDDRPGK